VKRVLLLAVGLGMMTCIGGSSVAAQSAHFGLGGGVTLPIRDYHTTDNAGWHVLGKVEISVPESPLDVRVDGMYSRTGQKAPSTGNTKLAGGTADLVWHIPTSVPGLRPYVLGGAGAYNVDVNGGSTTKFSWGAGLGASFVVGAIHAFAESRYISIHLPGTALRFVPVTAGLSFGP
jgi:Outer membrane protein beta-barrel domain